MKSLLARVSKTLVTVVVLSIAIAVNAPQSEAISLIEKDLFFGRNILGGTEVSEEEFEAFVDGVITPLFPDGLTISDADGQFRDSTGTLIKEPSKLVTFFVEDTTASNKGINKIVNAYLRQFDQESVLQVINKDQLKVGFGAGENLIDNDPIPEFIKADLFFGRNIPGGGEVSEAQFQSFVDSVITPLFPDGLTISDADGQFRDSTGTIIEEQSKVVTLLFEDTQENETAIDEMIEAYIDRFDQESVLLAVNEDIAVGFGAGENLIDNDPIPEFIKADLFFGRNIPGGGEVSEAQFQSFVDSVITPLFPDGLTISDADGQFRDSTGTIIEEQSKVVTLLFEDTQENETAIDEIIEAYISTGTIIEEQSKVVTLLFEDTQENETAIDEIIEAYIDRFDQESVLLVVDEEVEVAFDTQSVPETGSVLGLLAFAILGIVVCQKK